MPYIYNDEDNVPMDDRMLPNPLPNSKNCHERCRYSKICYEQYHCKGSHDPAYPYECAIYDKIDNIMMEVKDIPFFDPDEPCEEEMEDDADS